MMLTFLGATGTITGSTYAVTRGDACPLVVAPSRAESEGIPK